MLSRRCCAGVLEKERDTAMVFEPLPYHYLEVAHLLFTYAKDSFGADLVQARFPVFSPAAAGWGEDPAPKDSWETFSTAVIS